MAMSDGVNSRAHRMWEYQGMDTYISHLPTPPGASGMWARKGSPGLEGLKKSFKVKDISPILKSSLDIRSDSTWRVMLGLSFEHGG